MLLFGGYRNVVRIGALSGCASHQLKMTRKPHLLSLAQLLKMRGHVMAFFNAAQGHALDKSSLQSEVRDDYILEPQFTCNSW